MRVEYPNKFKRGVSDLGLSFPFSVNVGTVNDKRNLATNIGFILQKLKEP